MLNSESLGTDLPTQVFTALCDLFFDEEGNPKEFHLRDKRNTQDNPFDEYISDNLDEMLGAVECEKSSPLVSPDLVVVDPEYCSDKEPEEYTQGLRGIVSVEVKKLDRTKTGKIARRTGLDYNTTPPCATVRVYDSDERPLNIRGFYLFACLEEVEGEDNQYKVTALVLTDGNVLNKDFEFYKSIAVESREKEIGLGTYEDGMNRSRPMLVFPNPLGAEELDHAATLVHPNDDIEELEDVGELIRTRTDADDEHFSCYRQQAESLGRLEDPFPTPSSRSKSTSGRGKFRVDSI